METVYVCCCLRLGLFMLLHGLSLHYPRNVCVVRASGDEGLAAQRPGPG